MLRGGRGEDDHAYGFVPVPGKATLNLPAGTVQLRYQVSIRAEPSTAFGTPPDLEVTILPTAGGEPVPIERTPPGAVASTRNAYLGYVRAPIGRAEITAAGDYTVTAGPRPPATPEHTNPLVLLGR